MDISLATVKLAVLALPGLLGWRMYKKLRGRSQRPVWEDFCEILAFSIISYMLCAASFGLYHCAAQGFWDMSGFDLAVGRALSGADVPLSWSEIALACLYGLLAATVGSLVHRYRFVNNIARKLRVSSRSGDEDVWDYFHNSSDTGWIFVRDHRLGLVYYGAVTAFSESGEERELIIEDVSVYENNGASGEAELLYETPAMYIARERDDLTMELPKRLQPIRTLGESSNG